MHTSAFAEVSALLAYLCLFKVVLARQIRRANKTAYKGTR